MEYAIEKSTTGKKIRLFREIHHLTRDDFSKLAGVSKKTVEYWENSEKEITGPLCAMLNLINRSPELLEKLCVEEQPFALRLKYMFQDELCTVVDVDERNKIVRIKNYKNDNQFLAFGVNKAPTYEEYEAFLRERCFDETVDKKKVYLQELGVPFFDPMMIIEKTGGRMAGDDFHVEVIRK